MPGEFRSATRNVQLRQEAGKTETKISEGVEAIYFWKQHGLEEI